LKTNKSLPNYSHEKINHKTFHNSLPRRLHFTSRIKKILLCIGGKILFIFIKTKITFEGES